ncbi:MAG: hypothetical protein ACRDCT_06120, partial [Shewanella sp.]
MAFDEKFLQSYLAKQAVWSKNGGRSGSGRPYSVAVLGGNNALLSKSKANAKTKDSNPHAVALARLAANPVLREGGEYRGRKLSANHEHWEQVMLFDWLYRCHPEVYDDFTANPMGGLRSNKTANDLYDEGVKSGYPDVTGDVVRGVYHGIRIELKYGKNKASANQVVRLNRLTQNGYFCALCYGFDEARQAIEEYLSLADGESVTFDLN